MTEAANFSSFSSSASSSSSTFISMQVEHAVARITIARPQRRNALDTSCWLALSQICDTLATRADIRVVLLRGEGEHFCAGADIHELAENIQNTAWLRANQSHVADALDRFAALPQPTIAMIRGCCYGGGAALAISCDFRLAATDSRFAITPAKLGLTYRLVDCLRVNQLLGPARAREMLLLAREIDAGTALEWGLAGEVVPPERLDECVSALIEKLLALSGYSQRGIKVTMLKLRDGATRDDDETNQTFDGAFSGADFAEATAAFIAKRRPVFS